MKKFNLLIPISLMIYLILAGIFAYTIPHVQKQSNYAYRTEINRIMYDLEKGASIEEVDKKTYDFITAISYLPAYEDQISQISAFYEDDDESYVVMPWVQNETIKGYVRFHYRIPQDHIVSITFLVQGILLSVELCVLCLLWYAKKHLIQPFEQLSTLPQNLAKGHYKGSVKLEKSRYFEQFLWGMSQMQDTLNITKKRQIELLKEQKQLYLSLSHDIKTPLNLIKLYCKALWEHVYETSKQKEQIYHKIDEKCDEIERYINEIMKTAREDILDLQVKKDGFYLETLMKRVLDTYQEQCCRRQIQLGVGRFENRLLYGDIDRCQEIFENLFENAFKYGDGRRIELTFYEEDGCQLIRLFNTGIPMEEKEMIHVFESFYRGSNALHENGNGLGLYIVATLMHKMEGEVFVQLEEDGMAFVLVFH